MTTNKMSNSYIQRNLIFKTIFLRSANALCSAELPESGFEVATLLFE